VLWLAQAYKSIWVTLQAHTNIVAVAALLELAAIIITEGASPDQITIDKANEEGITLLSSKEHSFAVVVNYGRWVFEESKLKTYRAELHVHTVLSPCAQVEMIPPLIVRSALENHINLIAITDHNHTANIGAVQKAASGTGLVVLPGIEIQTREEVHVVCLFDTLEQAQSFQAFVDQTLPLWITGLTFLANSSL
jgi:predicted transcriptional regulator